MKHRIGNPNPTVRSTITECTSTGIREIEVSADIGSIMEKKAKMLQEMQEQETGIKRVFFTAPKTGKQVEYIIRQKKPYNLFTVESVVGRLPDDLSGAYTSFTAAETAIKSYLATRKESYYDQVMAQENNVIADK